MKWKPIETAPKEAVPILVAYDSGNIELVEQSDEYTWKPYKGRSRISSSPTHWMPLPPPPK